MPTPQSTNISPERWTIETWNPTNGKMPIRQPIYLSNGSLGLTSLPPVATPLNHPIYTNLRYEPTKYIRWWAIAYTQFTGIVSGNISTRVYYGQIVAVDQLSSAPVPDQSLFPSFSYVGNPPSNPFIVVTDDYELEVTGTIPQIIYRKRSTRPTYLDLVRGYEFDERSVPQVIEVTKTTRIGYYAKNPLEPIPNLTTIFWVWKDVLVEKDPALVPVDNIVLGTLWTEKVESVTLSSQSGYYDIKYLFADSIDLLFTEWFALRDSKDPLNITYFPELPTRRKIAANNDVWNNGNNQYNDINFDSNHPMFKIESQRSYDWHFKPLPDNETGDLIMDSPRIIEIHKSLDAGNYSTNRIDSAKKRENNLGYLVESIARVNGIRLDDNGDIDLEQERKKYTPATVSNSTLGEANERGKHNNYGMSCYGKIGLVIPHLPTSYKDGKSEVLYDVVHDHQQLMQAILRQIDISLSIQHGSEIRVNGADGKVQAYPNQLAVLLESLTRLEKISYQVEKNLLVSTVTGTEVRELFSGIGIPVTQKFIPLKDPINNKTTRLPYFGHQKSQPSTANLISNVQLNLAVINGVLMPKKQPKANNVFNPFENFKAK